MIRALRLDDLRAPLAAGCAGAWNPELHISAVSTDTRSLQPGDLFVALRGERYDAHDYLQEAVDAGAGGLVVEQEDPALDCPQLLVADTVAALGQLASINRSHYHGPLIGLTGSCGKTTTKEMLATVLSQCGPVHVTRGNLNNHIGVPLTLLAMPAGTRYAIIEMGASGAGEIDYLAGLSQPTVALVNNVMAAHLQGFGSEAGVAREKAMIYQHLLTDGVAIINLDEKYAAGWQQQLQSQRPDVKQLTFSLQNPAADVYASAIQVQADGHYEFSLHCDAGAVQVELPLPGRSNVANALAVAACCLATGVSPTVIASGLQRVRPVRGRLFSLPGRRGALVIDDSYNANPGSVKTAVDVLSDLQAAGRDTVLVLGDLAELGENAEQALTRLGGQIRQSGLRCLLTCGANSRLVQEAFSAGGSVGKSQHFATQEALLQFLNNHMTRASAVLVKGSRSARMETVVQAITSSGDPR